MDVKGDSPLTTSSKDKIFSLFLVKFKKLGFSALLMSKETLNLKIFLSQLLSYFCHI